MTTYIFITNHPEFDLYPTMWTVRNGKATGSSTTFCGHNRTHEHAIDEAKDEANYYSNAKIIDLWDRKYSMRALLRLVRMCK